MIKINDDIIPWEGLGGIKLYSSLRDLKDLIGDRNVKSFLYDNFLVRYEIKDTMYLFFNLINGKLFKLAALKNYKGKLFNKISIGMNIEDVLKLDNSFEYDDFEEVYISKKGIFIETDPTDNSVECISVFIKELETPSFEEANW